MATCTLSNEQAKQLKKQGYQIHFTGKTEPYGELQNIVDIVLPYWGEHYYFTRTYYDKDDRILLAGLFRERCVHAVNLLIPNSIVSKELTISHWVIGDSEGYFYDYDFFNQEKTVDGKFHSSMKCSIENEIIGIWKREYPEESPYFPTVYQWEMKEIPIQNIRRHLPNDVEKASDFADRIKNGGVFPPIIVESMKDAEYFLLDGYHRVYAYSNLEGINTVKAYVGTMRG
ncbi:ParB/RepB/Spo0J family partition protein (plasmid) [Aneurinibacillus sp. Ricciae_BoGa-3]|uniref:ParB/RepB/Spo0J family partition protein n=1 Tax=Aneurinibacillus sp. Ricciae_BoGa-3 TaxID=3022697 RepID=UPI0023405715|nr:ParB/RepB/Spo0J family partition protein [Aneurinibacillus sp. Ricciae_BoGa-3]WCK57398.1 ParB/RepB/Spo0J family partition protein [Aneurinibacillus sp. Ricciae_BoGa-3]